MNTQIAQSNSTNLSAGSRAVRLVIGAALIAEVMTTGQTPLGLLAVLPLLAIVPIFTGLTGWDPIKELCREERITQCLLHLPNTARMVIGGIGILMLGSVFMTSGAPGWLLVLPLLSVYPVFVAVIGEEPITALYNIDTSPNRVVNTSPVEETSVQNQPKQVEIATQVEDDHPLAA